MIIKKRKLHDPLYMPYDITKARVQRHEYTHNRGCEPPLPVTPDKQDHSLIYQRPLKEKLIQAPSHTADTAITGGYQDAPFSGPKSNKDVSVKYLNKDWAYPLSNPSGVRPPMPMPRPKRKYLVVLDIVVNPLDPKE